MPDIWKLQNLSNISPYNRQEKNHSMPLLLTWRNVSRQIRMQKQKQIMDMTNKSAEAMHSSITEQSKITVLQWKAIDKLEERRQCLLCSDFTVRLEGDHCNKK